MVKPAAAHSGSCLLPMKNNRLLSGRKHYRSLNGIFTPTMQAFADEGAKGTKDTSHSGVTPCVPGPHGRWNTGPVAGPSGGTSGRQCECGESETGTGFTLERWSGQTNVLASTTESREGSTTTSQGSESAEERARGKTDWRCGGHLD